MSIVGALLITVLFTIGVAGIFMVAWGWFGNWTRRPPVVKGTKPTSSSLDVVEFSKRSLLALVCGVIAYLVTGWPVTALFAFGAGFAWLSVRKAARFKAHQQAQISALATWVEGLKDTMAASAGISEALTISARIAPDEIKTEVNDLVIRMKRQPTAVALQQFAADVSNPASDMIVASLTLALTKQAGSLQEVLGAIARNARETSSMLQEIESGRSEVRAQSKLAVGVIGAVILGMVLLRRESLEPFGSFVGQLVLLGIQVVFALSGFLMYRLGKSAPQRRVFRRIAVGGVEVAQEVTA